MSEKTSSGPIAKIWHFFWGGVSLIRNLLVNGIFLIFLVILISSFMQSQPRPIADGAPLHIAPQGLLVDQLSYVSPSALIAGGEQQTDTLVSDLIEVINTAATDSRVNALILRLDFLAGGGMSKMDEVGQAIENFKAQNKPVIAYADYYSQQQYYLASYADEIYMHPMGQVLLSGFGMYRHYYKELIDKLTIDYHIFRVGTFKDAIEPFDRTSMSEASREHNEAWVNELWKQYTDAVELRREIEPGALNKLINNIDQELVAADGDGATLAKNAGLIDHVSSRIDRFQAFIERFGTDAQDETLYKHIGYQNYLAHIKQENLLKQGNIGLIIASGNIYNGNQPEGSIGGDSLSRLIRKARNDDEIKALVIRVNSGGGSAFASELIRHEIQATKAAGKPVFISMGAVAASGGYWISTAADQIWATPTTITGSIGVFSILPNLHKPIKKIGVNVDGFGTTEIASGFRPDMPLNPIIKRAMQANTENTYNKFLGLVSEARMQSTEDIDKISQGRVWTGTKALELGLIDQLGSLNDVIAAAAERAGISDYQVKEITRDLSPQEQLIRTLTQNAQATLGPLQENKLEKILDVVGLDKNTLDAIPTEQLELLKASNDKIYAQCLECVVH